MRAFLVVVLMATATPAAAETIYRCKAASGKVSLQNSPCAAGERAEARHYQTPLYSPDAAARLRRLEAERASARRSVQPSTGEYAALRGPTESQRRNAACTNTKQRREAMLKIAGMHRNFDVLRALDEQVHKACR